MSQDILKRLAHIEANIRALWLLQDISETDRNALVEKILAANLSKESGERAAEAARRSQREARRQSRASTLSTIAGCRVELSENSKPVSFGVR